MLPFYLVEQTRVFLDYLTRVEEIPETQRNMINEWLMGYSSVLAYWITNHYGLEGIYWASAEAQEVYNLFYAAVGETVDEASREAFEFWERDFGTDNTP